MFRFAVLNQDQQHPWISSSIQKVFLVMKGHVETWLPCPAQNRIGICIMFLNNFLPQIQLCPIHRIGICFLCVFTLSTLSVAHIPLYVDFNTSSEQGYMWLKAFI